nr:21 kDa protein-like [Tanacetum cinerariifolium]
MTTFQLPVLILTVLFLVQATTTIANETPSSDFISSSCKATTYPTLCVQTLSPYKKNHETQLAQAALTEVNDSLDRVRNSIRELKNVDHVKGQEFVMHMSNVQTWVSSALTDENTCMDGFSGGRVQKIYGSGTYN